MADPFAKKKLEQVYLLMESGFVRGVFEDWDVITEVKRKTDKTGQRLSIEMKTLFQSAEEFEEVLDRKLRSQTLARLTKEERRVLGLSEGDS